MTPIIALAICLLVSAVISILCWNSRRMREHEELAILAKRLRREAEQIQTMRKTYLQEEWHRPEPGHLLYPRDHFNALVRRHNEETDRFNERAKKLSQKF